MNHARKRFLAVFLVLVQLFVLCPQLTPAAEAAQTAEKAGSIPMLNKTIVGTLKFQSFNLLGSNSSDRSKYYEGTDYTTTYYYTDDYFARSARNTNLTGDFNKVQEWTALENCSMAACSAAFALASFTTNEANCVTRGGNSWNNTDYSNKDVNAKQFLSDCGFSAFRSDQFNRTADFSGAPQQDTIGSVIASKTITVWNPAENRNQEYTLIAVGVRGAGYGAEWANNVTIGDKDSHVLPANGRHSGFDESAKIVKARVAQYVQDNSITGNVKYWVTGFSRAAAVANLLAGYLTDENSADDVYAYTWECPQAASTKGSDASAKTYTNIHNIINPMDMVPKVSPDGFEHQRLGVDYRMPYYGNSGSSNTLYYTDMRNVLQTIAVGATAADGTKLDDPLIEATDPNNYPYNRPITPYTISWSQLGMDLTGLFGGELMNFGTVASEKKRTYLFVTTGNVDRVLGDTNNDGTSDWYLDKYIDELIDVFLTSTAWDRDYGDVSQVSNMEKTQKILKHRERFIANYQDDFRTLLGYMLDFSGPAFLGLIDTLTNAVTSEVGNVSWANIRNDLAIIGAFYNFQRTPSNESYKNNLSKEAKEFAGRVVQRMTTGYYHDSISKAQFQASLNHAVELVVDLYADEVGDYESQYFGTTLHWLNTILSTHEQETVLSWIMSLDPNHINRDCRTITLPADCSATLYEYRSQYGENLTDPTASAPKVAEIVSGQLVTDTLKDERIAVIPSGSNIVIRYPSSLQIRTDIIAGSAKTLSSFRVADYQTTSATLGVSLSEADQYQKLPTNVRYNNNAIFSNNTNTNKTNAQSVNNALTSSLSLQPGETLSITADRIAGYNDSNTSTYTVSLYRAPETVVTEFAMKTDLGAVSGSILSGGEAFTVSNGRLIYQPSAPSETAGASYAQHEGKTFTEKNLDSLANSVICEEIKSGMLSIRETITVADAGSIYYDDTLLNQRATTADGKQSYTAAVNQTANSATDVTKSSQISFRFTGSRIDVFANTDTKSGYIMASLLNEDGTLHTDDSGQLYNSMIGAASKSELYNLPVISFSGMDFGTYILTISVPQGRTFKLDGVRVYGDSAKTRTAYFPVRDMLLSAESWASGEVNGSVYLDYEQAETGAVQTYEASGPKGEVYLKPQSGVAFTIEDYDARNTYRIGLGAVENQQTTARVSGGTYVLGSPTHMFFDLTPDSSGNVVILNQGTALLSVTDIEVTYAEPETFALRLSAGPALMRYAADFSALPEAPEVTPEPTPEVTPEPTAEITPEVTPEATPEPTPEPTSEPSSNPGSTFSQLLSSFISSLFGSISRMFGH